MQIPILIEPIENGRYRARSGEPFVLSVEGETAIDAVRCLEQTLKNQLRNGAQIAVVDIPNGVASSVGPSALPADELYKTDWVFRELQDAIAENRRLEDSAET